MKFPIFTATALILFALAACGSGDDASGDAGLAGGSPVDGSAPDAGDITVECGADLGLTPRSGVAVDWMDLERGWTVEEDGGTFTLTRLRSCGDECSILEEIVLAGQDPGCPDLVSARSVTREAMASQGPTEVETAAVTGTLRIQDWDPAAGVFSGVLDAEAGFTFYAVAGR